jgi:hypothetical protein
MTCQAQQHSQQPKDRGATEAGGGGGAPGSEVLRINSEPPALFDHFLIMIQEFSTIDIISN